MTDDRPDTGLKHKWVYKPFLIFMEWYGEKMKQREIEEINERVHDK